ncbi:MAG: NUDIX hydrolase [Methylococcales bacterium]|nr:NUDIX hydrolase [Methylococcales bacterium]
MTIRQRVEVVLLDDQNRVALIEAEHDGKLIMHLPGGGLDEDTISVAAAKEVAEELGFECRIISVLDDVYQESSFGSGYKSWRAEVYDGVITSFVVAKIVKHDTSVLGLDGDAERFALIPLKDLIASVIEDDKSASLPLNRTDVFLAVSTLLE